MENAATDHTFKSYLFLWLGQLFSLLGSSIIGFVITWWIADTTGSAIYLSIAACSSSLPMVILTPFMGVFIDRWNRKITIGLTDFLQAFTTFWIILFFIFDMANVLILIMLNTVRAVFQAIHFPTVNAIIPVMIPKKHLSRMNGINYLFTGMIRAIGPVVAATLLLFLLIEQILWVDIGTFIIAIIPLLLITIPAISRDTNKIEKNAFIKDMKFGIKTIKKVPALLLLLVLISVINLLNIPFNMLMPLYVKINHLGLALDFAFVTAMFQAGVIIGAIISSIKKEWKNKEMIILQTIVIGIIGYLITTAAPRGNFLLIGIGGLIHASMMPIANTMFLTIIQTKVPVETQGRVFSITVSLAFSIMPIGMIISGPLSDFFGIYTLFISSLILQTLIFLFTWLFSNIRNIKNNEVKSEFIEDTKKIEN
ncbi:MAG: MFS transporter [Promethearchaeota archaeon]|jgi:DHA3 family macrolide efflux protein-like MFS transporter